MWANIDRMLTTNRAGTGFLTRRRVLGTAVGAALGIDARVDAATQAPQGLVLPRVSAPNLPLTDTLGRSIGLSTQLHGKVTAVQLMFAGCSATCPIQGAVFASVAQQVKSPDVRLLSLTVDPLGDSPQVLRNWLGRRSTPLLDSQRTKGARCRCACGIPMWRAAQDGDAFIAGFSV